MSKHSSTRYVTHVVNYSNLSRFICVFEDDYIGLKMLYLSRASSLYGDKNFPRACSFVVNSDVASFSREEPRLAGKFLFSVWTRFHMIIWEKTNRAMIIYSVIVTYNRCSIVH